MTIDNTVFRSRLQNKGITDALDIHFFQLILIAIVVLEFFVGHMYIKILGGIIIWAILAPLGKHESGWNPPPPLQIS